MTETLAIVLGTIGPSIVAWVGFKEFKDKSWLPSYFLLSALGLVWGGIAVYNKINHTILGSFPRAAGHVVTGALCGIVAVMALMHRKSNKQQEEAPPNQAL